MEDGRCKLGVAGRLQLVRLIESGCSLRSAAAQSAVSPATAHRWWHRWRQASEAERASRVVLAARARRFRGRVRGGSIAEAERRILDARARSNYGPARLAGLVGYRRSTVWKVLARHGVSRRRRTPRERSSGAMSGPSPERCCTWTPSAWSALTCPGTERPAVAASAHAIAAPAMSTRAARPMTTADWPTSSCTSADPPARPRRPTVRSRAAAARDARAGRRGARSRRSMT